MKPLYASIFFFSALLSSLMGELPYDAPSFMESSNALPNEPRLVINNRPLAKINGKVISLYDVVKKMNLFLFDYNPDYNPSTVELYQFYSSRWESTLNDMIADELVLMDAEQKEIKISDGEVREELLERFGPNVRESLDKVNLEYEEARDIIRSDLTVGQLLGMKVHAKAFQTVTPDVIKGAYEDYVLENPPKEEWKYQVLSIRGQDKDLCESLAQKAYELLASKQATLDSLKNSLEQEGITISVSEDFSGQSEKISKMHFDVIKALTPNTISQPVSQVSRFDNTTVLRIFYLKDVVKILPSVFDEMHDKLKNQLLYQTSDSEKEAYIDSLKKRFGYDTHDAKFPLPKDYHPFLVL